MKHRALGAGWAAVSELGKFAEGVRGGFSAMAFSTAYRLVRFVLRRHLQKVITPLRARFWSP